VSSEAYESFSKDDVGVVVSVLRHLGYEVESLQRPLNVSIRIYRNTVLNEAYPIRVSLTSYVKMAARFLSDPHWKVVNKAVLEGYVYLKPNELTRLAQEAVYKKVIKDVEEVGKVEVDALPDKLKEIVESISKNIKKSASKRRRIEVEIQGLVPEALPPCISMIYKRVLDGENLSHQERFALATFLLNVGMDVDEVLQVFSRAPDFNERIARYQVEHLAGLRGSRKKYSPPACKTLVSWNLCPGIGECKANHPLSEYRRRLWVLRKQSKGGSGGRGGGSGAQGGEGNSQGV
jgi:DNA primase large subunit